MFTVLKDETGYEEVEMSSVQCYGNAYFRNRMV